MNNNKIQIVCDSISSLDLEQITNYNIDVLPITIIHKNNEYKDGLELNKEDFLNILKSDELPKTSQVTYAQFKECFDKHIEEGKTILYISPSDKISGTYQSSVMAKNDCEKQENIHIFNSNNLSIGTTLFVLKAIELIDKGFEINEIIKELEILRDKVFLKFSVNELDYLIKGGRISQTKGSIGNILNIKPILEVKDGVVSQYSQVRGSKQIKNGLIKILKEENTSYEDKTIIIGFGEDKSDAIELSNKIKEELNPKDIIILYVGSTILCHSGPNVLGIASINN